ncbi:hypothetical protein BCR37DRAFT_388218 [Protomyces lactucae-debilis]|uniref:DUF642 domain-containing protein n=1 Tax=Protomyces lactucae-debilis TaxID=2754530 RepID=A0A1Y2FAN5_PROLT|nr:uncharacterized protein BCR37DRAFT_388218 [Protomyces lactucae-debilis]ORY80514.1 hypothetical protein BCR37DRAFT_388218 [Protomyces lactucae-debilis]
MLCSLFTSLLGLTTVFANQVLVYRDPENGNIAQGTVGYGYKQISATYTADSTRTAITFLTRHDPAFFYYDDFVFTVQNSSVNLLQNPGFESGLAPWVLVGQQGLSAAARVQSDRPHTGSFELKDGAVGGIDGVSQIVNTIVGTTYAFSFFVAADAGTFALSQVIISSLAPPTIMRSPLSDPSNPANLTVTGSAPGGQVITIYINDVQVATTTTGVANSYTASLDLSSYNGVLSITATTTAGGITSDRSSPLLVQYPPPPLRSITGVLTGRTLTDIFIAGTTDIGTDRPLTYIFTENGNQVFTGTTLVTAAGRYAFSRSSTNAGSVTISGTDVAGNAVQTTVSYNAVNAKCNRDNCLRGLFGSNAANNQANYNACFTALPTITISAGSTITGAAALPTNAGVCDGQGADKRQSRYISACACMGVVPTTTTIALA